MDRNLIIVQQATWQSDDDWQEIADIVRRRAPAINVYVVDDMPNPPARRLAADAPTLVFSAGRLRYFKPLRGRVYQGGAAPKPLQLKRLQAAGVPVPKWELIEPDGVFDPTGWGDHVVVKPADGQSSTGEGIKLYRTAEIAHASAAALAPGTRFSTGRIIVQEFINTGPELEYFRVLTMFGQPLYCLRTTLKSAVPILADGAPASEVAITNQAYGPEEKNLEFVSEPAVLALAQACSLAIPEAPLHGVDILRCAKSGKLYVLELNPGGNTWHFSSDYIRQRGHDMEAFGAAKKKQFGAFEVAAKILIQKTRSEAV